MPDRLPADFFRRGNDDGDEVFYSAARRVVGIDDFGLAKVGGIRAQNPPQARAILDLTRSFMRSGAFENMDSIDRGAPAMAPSDPVWAVAGYRTSRQQARRRAGETA